MAVLGLQMSVQILLVIGLVDEAVKPISVVPVVVQESDLDLVLLAVFEELRLKPYAVAVKYSFINVFNFISVNYQFINFRSVIINEKWLFGVRVNELGDSPSKVARALEKGHFDLISHVCEHALSNYGFFLSKMLGLFRIFILKFDKRFVETFL